MDDPRKEDELQLDDQAVSDLDVPDEDAAAVRGGRDDVVRQDPPDGGSPDGGTASPPQSPFLPSYTPPKGGSTTGTGCGKGGYSIRKGCPR